MSLLRQPRQAPCPVAGTHTITHSGQRYCDLCRPAAVAASNARSATSRQATAVRAARPRPLSVSEWNQVRQRWQDVVDLANTVAQEIEEEVGPLEVAADDRSAAGSAAALIQHVRDVDRRIGPILRRHLRKVDR